MKNKSELEFDKYISNYDLNVKQIRYKYYHSYEVEKLMKKIAIRLNLSKDEIKLAELIGLLHDIGRFEQVRKYGNCSDVQTGIDHADESCIYLFDEGHIRDFIEDSKYDEIIKDAIKNHNKYNIDKKVKEKNLYFSKMIRDMDKVDIYRVLSVEYNQKYDKDEISKKVYDTYKSHKTVDSHDKKSETDAIYAHIAFLYDFNFKESIDILKETKYLDDYFNSIEVEKGSEEHFNKFREEVHKYLDNK